MAKPHGQANPHPLRDLIDLAFLSPKLIDAIVAGKQPAHISAKSLSRLSIPDCLTEQHALFDRV